MSVQLVGILNVTPDSFSDGGQFFDPARAIQHAEQLFADGASLIDIGAESTNPWSTPLTPEEEWQRLEPVLQALVKEFPGKLSIDTYHPETARRALEAGVTIINDVTMFRDSAMVNLAAKYKDTARYIVSHLSPKVSSTAEAHKVIPTTTLEEVKSELLVKRQELLARGVPAKNIILDPGIGFGKTMELNWQLLEFAKEVPGIAVMIGYSRKRFLNTLPLHQFSQNDRSAPSQPSFARQRTAEGTLSHKKTADTEAAAVISLNKLSQDKSVSGENRMEIEPNLEAGRIAIQAGAKYLRVHDVAAHVKFL